ncbi:MAG: DMT family transporter [Nitratireductor sp.]|nr:DMT family transporter [Nitratireductor sp.]
MTVQQNNPRKGAALGFVGGFVISFDIPMIKLAGAEGWTSLAIRASCLALIFIPLAIIAHRRARANGGSIINRNWLEVGALYGLSNILFTFAVFSTSTANLVFILALSSLLAALFAWLMIGERPAKPTLLAIATTLTGVLIIVGDGLGSGTTFGDLCALGAALSIAFLLVRTRQTGGDMSLAPGFGGIVALVFALPVALAYSPMPQAPEWLFANGLIVVPIAAWCLALAPRYVPAPQVAMFYLIETVLAPVWVWFVFGETVSGATLAGGTIVLAAITAHSLWNMRAARPVSA